MTKLDVCKIYFCGSRQYFKRLVWEYNGKYFCKWYNQMIEIFQVDGDKCATSGWKTVEPY